MNINANSNKILKKTLEYLSVIGFSFAVIVIYFQVATYPYKVARWYQPMQAWWVSIAATSCEETNTLLQMMLSHSLNYHGAYSTQVAFVDAQKRMQHCEAGYKSVFGKKLVNQNDRYRYASSTKLITAAAILRLVKQQKISLNDKLVHFFPELTRFKDERVLNISLEHLLNHSAGFDRLGVGGDPMFLSHKKPWCPDNLSKLQSLQLVFSPGTKQIYSNLGFCLLGEVIHRVSGESYRTYIARTFSLASRDIKFVNNFYNDEVQYDYRYEEFYNDDYLELFDFDAISSVAGLSGSATALAELIWDIHHQQNIPLFTLTAGAVCELRNGLGCISRGVFHYQPEPYGLAIHFHEGYLPGSASLVVVDSFGGVLTLTKSGANRYQENPTNDWVRWIYKRLSLHYLLQGKLPILNSLSLIKH